MTEQPHDPATDPATEHEAEHKQEKNNKWQTFNEHQVEAQDEEPTANIEQPSYETLQTQLTEAEQKAQENWDKFTRSQAEMENLRRRTEKDLSNAHKYGQDKLLSALLPVIDSLERAIETSQNEAVQQAMVEGLELTLKLFLDTLDKHGVKQLNPQGEVFDPNFHQAISMQETQEVDAGCVLNVIQKGYKLHERVLRPALVVVAKA